MTVRPGMTAGNPAHATGVPGCTRQGQVLTNPARPACFTQPGPAAVLPEGDTDMTGSGLAAILIQIAGTIFLATWLALVFYTGGHPRAGQQPSARPPKPRPGRPG